MQLLAAKAPTVQPGDDDDYDDDDDDDNDDDDDDDNDNDDDDDHYDDHGVFHTKGNLVSNFVRGKFY